METNPNGGIFATARRNILVSMVDKGLTKNGLAKLAGIPSTSFDRNINNPEKFSFRDLGSIAQALDKELTDLLRDAA